MKTGIRIRKVRKTERQQACRQLFQLKTNSDQQRNIMKKFYSSLLFSLVALSLLNSAKAQIFESNIGAPRKAGQFVYPYAVATDPSGNVFVADPYSNMISKFSSTGTYMLQWGGFGSTDGKFNTPFGIAVDASGFVYVLDTYNNRVQKFTNQGVYQSKFGGTYGTADGQFGSPRGIVLDASGNIYVADTYNHRIQKFNNAGTFQSKFGSYGTGDGQFNAPQGISIDPTNGSIYVADTENHRMQKFTSAGVFQLKTGSFGSTAGRFQYPRGCVVDATGNLYVPDTYNNRIQKLNSLGVYQSSYGSSGSGNGQFLACQGIAMYATGSFYVADSDNTRVQKFDANFAFITAFGGFDAVDQLLLPDGSSAVDANGNIYVSDSRNNRIVKFNTQGVYQSNFGGLGSGDGKFNFPRSIVIDPVTQDILVCDAYNNRIQRFTNAGIFKSKFGSFGSGDGQFAQPFDIALDNAGNIYVADVDNSRIQKFNNAGTFQLKFGSRGSGNGSFNAPRGVEVDASGNIYVADEQNQRVQKFNSTGSFQATFGSFGSSDGQLSYPTDLCIDANGNLLVSDTYNSRVQRFTTAGQFLSKFGAYGAGNGQLNTVRGVSVDAKGYVYVTDSQNHRIVKFATLSVSSLSVSKGAVGADVVITGTGFSTVASENSVKFNGITASVSASTSTSLTVKVPTGAATGLVSVTRGGIVGNSATEFLVLPFAITSFSPSVGASGTPLTLTGTGFSSVNANNVVKFNGTTATVTSSSPTTIIAQVPAGATPGKITVTTADETATSADDFGGVLAITSFAPPSAAAGASVTITGTGFSTDRTRQTVRFTSATGTVDGAITASSLTSITATVPATAVTGKISVTRETATVSSATEFLMLPFAITSFSPINGAIGSVVTIQGSGFSSVLENNTVKFGTVTATPTAVTPTSITVPVPTTATTATVSVTTEGQTATSANVFTVVNLRITAKAFTDYVTVNGSAAQSISVNDINEVSSIAFLSKGITAKDPAFKSVPIPLPTGNSIVYQMPDFTDAVGMRFYFSLKDKEGNEVKSEEGYTYKTYPAASSTQQIPNLVFGKDAGSYQLISIPLELADSRVESVFKDLGKRDKSKWRLYAYAGRTIELGLSDAIDVGKGYWLIAKNSTTINPGEGSTVAVKEDAPYVLKLVRGWNLIGNPYNFTISWADVLAANGNPTGLGNLRFYKAGSFTSGNLLGSYKGAFVRLDGVDNLDVKVPVINQGLTGGRVSAENEVASVLGEENWQVRLTLEDGKTSNDLAGFGMGASASENLDQWDEIALPTPEGVGSFSLTMRQLGRESLIKDVVKTSDRYTWAGKITSDHGVALHWDNTGFGLGEQQLMLEADDRVSLVDMRAENSISLAAGERQFKIHYGNALYIKEASQTKDIVVGQLYPNPLLKSSGSVKLPISLAETISQVRFTMMDATGRLRATSGEGTFDAGRQEVEWANDFSKLGSGVYLLKVEISGDQSFSSFYRKVIVVD